MTINSASGVAIWRQIANDITEQIRSGKLQVGDRVPATREVAEQWQVAYTTASSALAELRKQNLIVTERGRGSRVAHKPHLVRHEPGRYQRDDELGPTGRDYDRADRPFEIRGAVRTEHASPAIAERLHVASGDLVSRVDYVWMDDSGPTQYSTQWEPLALTKGTTAEVPPKSGLPNVISRFAAIGYNVDRVSEDIYNRPPTSTESDELAIGEDIHVFYIERTHSAGDTPVETANIIIPANKGSIHLEHTVDIPKQEDE